MRWLVLPALFVIFAVGALGIALVLREQDQNRIDGLVTTANLETVSTCYSQAAQGPTLRRVLLELEGLFKNPRVKQEIRSWVTLSIENTPTIRDCNSLAAMLNVDRPKEVNG